MEIRLMPSAFISEMQSKSMQFRNDSIHEVLSSLQIKNRIFHKMSPKRITSPTLTIIL